MRSQQIVTPLVLPCSRAWRTRLPWLFVVVLGLILVRRLLPAATRDHRKHASVNRVFRSRNAFCGGVHFESAYIDEHRAEFNDKGLNSPLSFDIRRSYYILGRLLGFALIALLMAVIATLPQLLLAPLSAALQWGISLALELALMAALSLFCIVTFTQLMPAASFVFGFYLLARTLTAIRLMSDTPLFGGGTLTHQVATWLIDLLALVLPSLDRYTQSIWLSDHAAAWPALAALALQTLLYIVLLGAAAMFDFYRRNL
jgi:hypothetical protein